MTYFPTRNARSLVSVKRKHSARTTHSSPERRGVNRDLGEFAGQVRSFPDTTERLFSTCLPPGRAWATTSQENPAQCHRGAGSSERPPPPSALGSAPASDTKDTAAQGRVCGGSGGMSRGSGAPRQKA